MITKVAQSIQDAGKIVSEAGKRKIPRYLYHLTGMKNFNDMQKYGYCFAKGRDVYMNSGDPFFEYEGVYLFDLMNFLKDWKIKVPPHNKTLQEGLVDMVSIYHDPEMAILRIPTSKLDKDKLRIRSQHTILEAVRPEIRKEMTPERMKHLKYGEPAYNSGLYRQRKCPIEFIYKRNIPADSIELAGTLTAEDIKESGSKLDLQKILTKLFKGTPEETAVKKHFEING